MTTIRRVQTVVTGVAGTPYYITGTFDAAIGTASTVISAWHTFCTPNGASGLPSASVWTTGPEVDLVDDVTGDLVGREFGISQTVTGSNAGDRLPPANQYLVTWLTGIFVGGRELRGRTFLPLPFENGSTSTGTVEPTQRAGILANATTLINGANAELRVWSRKNGVSALVNNATVGSTFAVLRSRRD